MKIVSATHMSELESTAYKMGFSEADFMEQAGIGISKAIKNFIKKFQLTPTLLLLCGKGNNTGDGFVASSYLLEEGYKVYALQQDPVENCSTLCQLNRKRFESKGGIFIRSFAECPHPSILVDGIFGTGFKGMVKEPYAKIIQEANQSKIPILAIDIPSGLDGTTGQVQSYAIQATETLYLGLPKQGFFFNQGWNTIGKLQGVNFGLPHTIINQTQSDYQLLTQQDVIPLLPPIKRSRHKYQAGFVVGLAGSPSMPGAALISSLSALRAGSGIVKLLHSKEMDSVLSHSPYELIKIPYDNPESIVEQMNKAGSIFIGPGLGKTKEVEKLLHSIIPRLEKPCVLDADALTLFAENPFKIPAKTILTPHLGEMQRLLHSSTHLILNQELMSNCQKYVNEHQVTLILKGSPTFIFHPNFPILISPTGDPGMATAGSGDVLTGLVASLLSQGLACQEAAALGTFLHGLAGEIAAEKLTSYCLLAGDLIENFSAAYKLLMKKASTV